MTKSITARFAIRAQIAAPMLIAVLLLALDGSAIAGDSARVADADSNDAMVAAPNHAADASAPEKTELLSDLEDFLRQREVDVDGLTVEKMLGVMIDWYRTVPIASNGEGAGDMLQFRYGGWSEGCATGFNVSLMRRAVGRGAAGITLMFEPSGGAELDGFSTALSDPGSMVAFVEAVRSSPAFQAFGSARTMGAMIEKGGLR